MSIARQNPLVSIIIPTFNSENQLALCLDSIKNQDYKNYEIIIVDYYSTDKTIDIASQYTSNIFRRKTPFTERRNYGATKANGEIFYQMDSDMMLSKDLIEKGVEQILNGYDGIIIPQRYAGEGFLGKSKELEVKSSTNDDSLKICRFMTKKAFNTVGGYDTELEAGEDWDITQRIEEYYQLIRINSYITHGWGTYNLTKWIRKMYFYGKSVKKYQVKHKTYSKYQWSPLRFFLLDYTMLRKDPLHACGLLFIKVCEFSSGFLGLLTAPKNKFYEKCSKDFII